MNTNPSALTICIPAKNESRLLPALLMSLTRQDYPHMRHTKVFLADAGSTDGTPQIALGFRDRMDIEVIPGGLPSHGRNAGAARTQSEFVLFLDADIELKDPTLLRRAVELAERRKLDCVTTNIWCSNGTFADNSMYAFSNFMQYLSVLAAPFATGMFMLFRTSKFKEFGGFHEGALFAEDYLLSKKVGCRRFGIISGGIHTTNRRFAKMGHMKVASLFINTFFHSFSEKYFL